MILRDVLGEAATAIADLATEPDPDGAVKWMREGYPFAVLSADGTVAEFWLDPPVAAAASRTPDVSVSERGPGWVRFSPAVLDEHGVDRAVAWLASAHRRLAKG